MPRGTQSADSYGSEWVVFRILEASGLSPRDADGTGPGAGPGGPGGLALLPPKGLSSDLCATYAGFSHLFCLFLPQLSEGVPL